MTLYHILRTSSNCVPSLNGLVDIKSINITDVYMLDFASKMEKNKKLAGAIIVFFNKKSVEILKIKKIRSLAIFHNPDIRYYFTSVRDCTY